MNAQVKAVLEKMSSVEKYFRTAPYLRCGEILPTQNGQITACNCEGWKNPALFYTEPYIMKEDEQHSCAACKHKIVSHGNLNAIKPEELDKVVCVVMQIEQHIQEAQRLGTDPVQANKHTERANQLKQILGMKFRAIIAQNLANYQAAHQGTFTTVAPPEPMEVSDPKSNDYIGNPPFEKPVIIQILKNYMEYKYAPLRAKNPIKAKGAEKIVKLFVVGLNKFELPPPTDQLSDRIYLVNYKRWRYYCMDSKRPCRLVEIFGRTLLRTIMKQVVEALMKNGYFTQDIEPFVPEFFIDLEKEVNTETSVTLLEDFAMQLKAREIQNVPPGVIQPPAQGPTPVMPMAAPEEVTTLTAPTTTTVTPPAPAPTTGSQRKRKNQAASQETAPVTKVTPGRNKKQKQTNNTEEPPAAAAESSEGGSQKGEGEQLQEVSGEVKRNDKARKEEADGEISFEVISNDRVPQHMIWLTACKNIFSKQLPMMPKEYIVRLVFDRNHRSLVLLKHNKVYGAISFRPYHEQGFLEIAFCAITATEQGKGYGSFLMNHLKDHAQKDGILTFLTYADNYAIVFFKKQGFTKTIDHPRKKWQGFIKDYDGGTLMECRILPNLNYLKIPEMVALQKKAINDKINEIASSHVVHKGLVRKENGTITIEQIPGIRETGWRIHAPTEEDSAILQQVLEDVLQKIKDHPSSWPFLVPVNREEVPDYYDVIKDPIDLETIEKRLHAKNYYITKEIFLADIKRMCDNCRVYNREDTEYYKCANDIQNEFLKRGRYFKKLEAPVQNVPSESNNNNSTIANPPAALPLNGATETV